jgi:hypothetical protein
VFCQCDMEEITIPSSIVVQGRQNLFRCHSLHSVHFEDHSQLTRVGEAAFSHTGLIFIKGPPSVRFWRISTASEGCWTSSYFSSSLSFLWLGSCGSSCGLSCFDSARYFSTILGHPSRSIGIGICFLISLSAGLNAVPHITNHYLTRAFSSSV